VDYYKQKKIKAKWRVEEVVSYLHLVAPTFLYIKEESESPPVSA
jgi:hypothetical protein